MSTRARAPWFTMQARSGGTADIAILSDIGDFSDGGLTAAGFRDQLLALGNPSRLNITITSNGGDVSTGFAIHAMLARHAARKIVRVEGLAASMASVIAMVGDEITIDENAMIMVHHPYGVAVGESDTVIAFGEALEKMSASIVKTYAQRTGLDESKVRGMMDRETWMDADEAVKLGFADRITASRKMAAQFAPGAFKKFAHVPARAAAMLTGGATRSKPAPLAAAFERAYPSAIPAVAKPRSWDDLQKRAFDKLNSAAKRSDDNGDSGA